MDINLKLRSLDTKLNICSRNMNGQRLTVSSARTMLNALQCWHV